MLKTRSYIRGIMVNHIDLFHSGMNVETRIAELCYLLCEEFNTMGRIAENNWLIDL